MKNIIVYPYKMGSASGKLLANALGAKRVYPDRNYSPKDNHVIVNWGAGFRPAWNFKRSQMLNQCENICNAVDKLTSFKMFKAAGVRYPELTRDPARAMGWLANSHVVVGRDSADGTRGQNTYILQSTRDFKECLFYTKYVPPTMEYRIYTFGDHYVDGLEKRRLIDRLNEGTVDPFIRTEENGWVFCRPQTEIPNDCKTQAIAATASLGLLFGGVDIIWNNGEKKAYALEVNTAPGIYGVTVGKYAKEITTYVEGLG